MRLTQTEIDRVLIFNIAEMARRRRAKGLRLNHPEAVALISDEMMERAREGADYQEVRNLGLSLLTPADVMEGVPALCRGLTLEPMFEDGPRIIVLPDPIAGAPAEGAPGERLLADAPIEGNAGRDVVTVEVTNGSDHMVNVSSHYHFYEVNPRMVFDRAHAYGRHLDIQAGRSEIWQPGETRTVSLVPYAGDRVVDGFQRVPPPVAVKE
jgi:urease subunit gamma/beta